MLLKLPFKPWQPEAVRRAVLAKKFAIFDTVGVGKTVESIGIAELLSKSFTCKTVIVAESSHVLQWRDEFFKFSNLKVFFVASGSKDKRHKIYKDFFSYKGSAVLIINYGKLRFDFDVFRTNHFDAIIYDEALILSNFNETRQFAKWLNQKTEFVFALTATPFSRDIMQWFDLFECLGIAPISRTEFLERFAVYTTERIRTKRGTISKVNVTGAKNLPHLKNLYAPYYIRRTKKEVKPQSEIVDKNIFYRLFDLDKNQKALYAKIKDGLIQTYRGSLEVKELEPLSAYTTTIQVLDSAHLIDERLPKTSPKIDGLLKTLEEISEDKVFIYSRFKKFGSMIEEALKDEGVRFIHGDLDIATLNKYKNDFLNSPKVKYLVATDIAQRGLNLQVANTIIFMDLPPTPDAIFQLIGRLDREGQQSPFINVFFMLADNSVEFNLFSVLKDRQKVFDEVLDESGSQMFSVSKEEFLKLL